MSYLFLIITCVFIISVAKKKGKKKKQMEIDKGYLCCQHHVAMVTSFAFVDGFTKSAGKYHYPCNHSIVLKVYEFFNVFHNDNITSITWSLFSDTTTIAQLVEWSLHMLKVRVWPRLNIGSNCECTWHLEMKIPGLQEET